MLLTPVLAATHSRPSSLPCCLVLILGTASEPVTFGLVELDENYQSERRLGLLRSLDDWMARRTEWGLRPSKSTLGSRW